MAEWYKRQSKGALGKKALALIGGGILIFIIGIAVGSGDSNTNSNTTNKTVNSTTIQNSGMVFGDSVEANTTQPESAPEVVESTPVVTEPEPTPAVVEPEPYVAPTPTPAPTYEEPVTTCCKICSKGKACGDSCISRSYTCHKPPGCACDG